MDDENGRAEQRPKLIYIVDDEPGVRRSTSFFLSSAGYQPRGFMSGMDFLDEVAALDPGVVLLDFRMPEVDGLTLVERLPAPLRPLFPVVMITGHGDLNTAVRAMRQGVRDFLEKPYAEHDLLAIVERLSNELLVETASRNREGDARFRLARLSTREREVLAILAEGKPNKTVAHELGLSVRTVEMHRAQMLERLGVRTLPEAIRLAITGGLLA